MSDYPFFKGVVSDAAGEPLTLSTIESAIRHLKDPERLRREAEYREQVINELNLRAKTYWARLHGKTAEELTSDDMAALNEAFFQSWLKYKGVSEQEFKEFFGVA